MTALVQQRKIEFAFEEDKYAWNVSRIIITASFRLYFIKFYSAISTIRTLCAGRYALISCKWIVNTKFVRNFVSFNKLSYCNECSHYYFTLCAWSGARAVVILCRDNVKISSLANPRPHFIFSHCYYHSRMASLRCCSVLIWPNEPRTSGYKPNSKNMWIFRILDMLFNNAFIFHLNIYILKLNMMINEVWVNFMPSLSPLLMPLPLPTLPPSHIHLQNLHLSCTGCELDHIKQLNTAFYE